MVQLVMNYHNFRTFHQVNPSNVQTMIVTNDVINPTHHQVRCFR